MVAALHTDRTLAQQIIEQGRHYLMPVKANQPQLQSDIELLFEAPPWQAQGGPPEFAASRSVNKGHGRLDVRQVQVSSALDEFFDWP